MALVVTSLRVTVAFDCRADPEHTVRALFYYTQATEGRMLR